MYSRSLFLLDGTNWRGTFIFWATPLLLHDGITFTFLYFHFHLFLMHVSSTQWHSPLHHSSPLPLGERIWLPVSQITGSQLSANKDSFFSPEDIPRKRQQSELHNLQNHLESSFQIRGCRLLELWIKMIMINHELCNQIIGWMMMILEKFFWAHFNYSCFMGMLQLNWFKNQWNQNYCTFGLLCFLPKWNVDRSPVLHLGRLDDHLLLDKEIFKVKK